MVVTEGNLWLSPRMFERKQGWLASVVSQVSCTCSSMIPPETAIAS